MKPQQSAELPIGEVSYKTVEMTTGEMAVLAEAAWRHFVAQALLNPSPVNPLERMKEAAKQFPMSPEESEAFRRAGLPVRDSAITGGQEDDNGPDRLVANIISRLWTARVYRAGVASGLHAPSKECDDDTVKLASDVAFWSLDALAAWTPEFFNDIARWMRACGGSDRPTWATVVHQVRVSLESEGVPVTKAMLRCFAKQRMGDILGAIVLPYGGSDHESVTRLKQGKRYINEPSNWDPVFKKAGCSDVPNGKPGPAPGADNAGRPKEW